MKKVVVTGGHRHGTTATGKAIAHDYGFEFIPEEAFDFSSPARFCAHLNSDKAFVIQAPWLAPFIHQYANLIDECIWVNRHLADVQRSRANMRTATGQPISWNAIDHKLRLAYNALNDHRDIAAIQYENWQYQKTYFANAREVNYEDFSNHPIFVKNRVGFHYRQTEAGSIVDRKPWLGDPLVHKVVNEWQSC